MVLEKVKKNAGVIAGIGVVFVTITVMLKVTHKLSEVVAEYEQTHGHPPEVGGPPHLFSPEAMFVIAAFAVVIVFIATRLAPARDGMIK